METIQYIFIIFGPCFTVLSSGTIGDILGDKFDVLKINYGDIVQPISSYVVNAKSILDCSRQCLNSETCLSVLYYRDKKVCSFNTQLVQFQSDAVIPSSSSSDVLVPIVKGSWALLPETTTALLPETTTALLPPTPASLSSCTEYFAFCPDGWFSYGDSCYFFTRMDPSTWTEALQKCTDQCSYLVKIDSAEEDQFIRNTLNSLGLDMTGVWAGGNDLANEGSWVWGYPAVEAISYMNWGSGEPNSMGDEDCLALYPFVSYQWVDFICNNPCYYMCEMELTEGG